MLLRAVGRSAAQFVTRARQSVSFRTISLTRAACSGGHDHHGPPPVHIPVPGSLDWSLCGTPGVRRISEDRPYKPGSGDIGSFVGAAVFVLLTFLAVAFKTDALKKEEHFAEHKKHQAAIATIEAVEETPAVEEVHEEPTASSSAEEVHAQTTSESSEPAVEEVAAQEAAPAQTSAETPAPTPAPAPEPTPVPASEESEPAPETSASSTNEETTQQPSETPSNETGLHCEYVIVGSGTAAYYASLAIRAKEGEARVLMIGEEDSLPYNRPPLSKELWWYGDESSSKKLDYTSLSGKKRDIFYEVEGFFAKPEEMKYLKHGGVTLLRGKKVVKVCVDDRKVILDDGSSVGYEKLLIATGTRPKKEEVFEKASNEAKEKITYYFYPDDFKKVETGLSDKTYQNVTIVGNSVLASELAYSIKRKYENVEVHQVFEQKYNADEILPEHLAKKSTEAIEKMGVKVHSLEKVENVRKCCKNVVLKLEKSGELRTDLIIVANGEEANNDIAEASGLNVDERNGGVKADKYLKVAENVYTAGAVASFEDSVLGQRRISSWEHAQVSGRLAGENMTNKKKSEDGKAFWYQPSFFTKFAPQLHLNAVGNVDSKLDTVTVYAEPNAETQIEKGVVFYKSKETGNVVGVLLVNVFGPSLDVARRIIDDRKNIEDFKELAKLFPLYEPPKAEENAENKN